MDLSTTVRESETGTGLQSLLVDLVRLHLLAKHFHWNAAGREFRSLHATFDEFAGSYLAWSDRLAGRMRALGDFPDGRPRAIATAPEPHDVPARGIDTDEAMRRYLPALDAVAARVKDAESGWDVDDAVTHDVLTAILEGLDLQRWMLRSLR